MGIGVLMKRKARVLASRRSNRATGDDFDFSGVEKVFGLLMMFTACAMAFAHGSNDVANAVGPLAAIISVVDSAGQIGAKASMPWWVLGAGWRRYRRRPGHLWSPRHRYRRYRHHRADPVRGFAATLAAASTVVLASGTGLPISTTHTLVGAVLGVGLARGMAALNLRVIGTIVMSWLITLPAGAILSILFFFMFKGMFG